MVSIHVFVSFKLYNSVFYPTLFSEKLKYSIVIPFQNVNQVEIFHDSMCKYRKKSQNLTAENIMRAKGLWEAVKKDFSFTFPPISLAGVMIISSRLQTL